jgi:hypothetical protein
VSDVVVLIEAEDRRLEKNGLKLAERRHVRIRVPIFLRKQTFLADRTRNLVNCTGL